jgi:methionyl-tRNA synthetase
VQRYGIDALRYFLLRHVGPRQDADVDDARIASAYRSELADGLGNLLSRTVALLRAAAGARVPPPPVPGLDPPGELLVAQASQLERQVNDAVERFAPDDALRAIWALVAAANKHLADTAPWALAKKADSAPRVQAILHHACSALDAIGRSLVPFLPATATAIANALAAPERPAPLLFPKTDLEPGPPRNADTAKSR